MTRIESFSRDQRGGVAILFALLLLPLMAAVGAAIDYSRASNVRTAMQAAVDAAALLAARDSATLSDSSLADRARQVFLANFRQPGTALDPVRFEKTSTTIRVSVSGSIKTVIMGIFRINAIQLAATGEAAWGQNRIELALVLDNTGSMAALNKMSELKKAVRDLLATLETASPDRNAIKVSIVPFDTQVNIGDENRNANWLTFNANVRRSLRTTQTNWRGCVADRDMPYDTNDTSPTASATLYPAVTCGTGSLAQLRSLTGNFSDLRASVSAMQPSGNTNITIGIAWGLASLSPSTPLDQAVPFGTPRVKKIMIVLTDGDNTENRFTSDPSAIDARTRQVCDTVKNAGVKVHTIRVIEGNAKLLRDCASAADTYHEVRNASELGPVFRSIASEITGIRLAQ
jgi:Flp pilus assembly protein TadG